MNPDYVPPRNMDRQLARMGSTAVLDERRTGKWFKTTVEFIKICSANFQQSLNNDTRSEVGSVSYLQRCMCGDAVSMGAWGWAIAVAPASYALPWLRDTWRITGASPPSPPPSSHSHHSLGPNTMTMSIPGHSPWDWSYAHFSPEWEKIAPVDLSDHSNHTWSICGVVTSRGHSCFSIGC